MTPLITVAIPTKNRASLLADSIASVLAQTLPHFELLVLDAGSDNTGEVVSSLSDSRTRYIQLPAEIGIIDAWNACIEQSTGEYILVLSDDDRLHPNFLSRSAAVLDRYENVGFTFTHANKTDMEWRVQQLWGYVFPSPGLLTSKQYLEFTLTNECCVSLSSTVLMRRSVYQTVGKYRAEYGNNNFDFNLYLRAARSFPAYFIDEVLVDYRLHEKQVTETHWRNIKRPTGKISTYLNLIGLVGTLLNTALGIEEDFLALRLLSLASNLSRLLSGPFPEL